MQSNSKSSSWINLPIYGKVAFFGVGFFLVTMLLTAFIIIPKVNQSIESQHLRDVNVELTLEAALFQRFVENQRTILQDLARFPSLTNAVMLSNADSPAITDLFDNVVISGEKGRLVLQDIAGSVLIQTVNDLQGSYTDNNQWLEQILSESKPYHFQLLTQKGNNFSFQISVPVIYNSFIEGVLSAEISVSLEQVFVSQTLDHDVAFTLTQNDITISTEFEHIEVARKNTLQLTTPELLFTYITDEAPVLEGQRSLRNTILSVLLFSLAISFLLFALLGYRGLVSGDKKAKINHLFIRAYKLPIVIGVIGVSASFAAYLIVLSIQQDSYEKKLNFDSKQRIQALREKVKSKLVNLDSIKAFYQASASVSREEFKTFVAPFLSHHPSTHKFEWIPNVANSQRNTYERRARRDGIDGFTIKEMNNVGDFIPAQQRDVYFPVYYVEPLKENEKTMGFDLATSENLLAVLNKVRISGEKLATAPVTQIYESTKQVESLIFYAVYSDKLSNDDSEGKELLGFVVMVVQVEDLINETSINGSTLLSLYVQDISDPDRPEVIYGDKQKDSGFYRSEVIDVAGRAWQITSYASANNAPFKWIPWLILIGGLVFSGLITAGLIHHIRRRKVVELLVKERTADLRMLSATVANSNDIFLITQANELDMENGGPKIIYVNEAFTQLTGYSAEEVIGNTPRMFQGKNTDRLELDRIRIALQAGDTYLGELVNYTKDGKEYWIEVNISPLKDETGKIIQFAAVQRNITERKQAEAERGSLIESLTRANGELAQFAYRTSHDLKAPLSASKLLTRFIVEDIEAGDIDNAIADVNRIYGQMEKLEELVASILSLTEADAIELNNSAINLDEVVDEIQQRLSGIANLSDYTVLRELCCPIISDKTRITQILENLISNALKYRDTTKSELSYVKVTVSELNDAYQLIVADNGIGIPVDRHKEVFHMFKRFHPKLSFGSGLGLAIVKKHVDYLNGTILMNTSNGGTTFSITIPKVETL